MLHAVNADDDRESAVAVLRETKILMKGVCIACEHVNQGIFDSPRAGLRNRIPSR